MTDPNESEESNPDTPVAQIIVTFTGGPHTTGISVAMHFVDTAQLELAGHFLVRSAEKLYRESDRQVTEKITAGGISLAPPGFQVKS